MKKIRPLTVFSIKYPYGMAVDWDLWKERRWWESYSSYGLKWYPEEKPLNKKGWGAILKKFHLWYFRKEYPIERIERKSPAWFMAERRKKEKKYGLRKAGRVYTDNIGGEGCHAEMYQ